MNLWTIIGVISGLVQVAAALALLGIAMTLQLTPDRRTKCHNRN